MYLLANHNTAAYIQHDPRAESNMTPPGGFIRFLGMRYTLSAMKLAVLVRW